ncbi:MAG: hypothetical protein ACYYKD_10230 [Rhodospirillales bacterium]
MNETAAPEKSANAPAPKGGGLQQMTMAYSAEDDRILFRMSNAEHEECRMWFTRRFTRVLWEVLKKGFQQAPDFQKAIDPKTREAMLAMQHHDALKDKTFTQGTGASPDAGPDAGPDAEKNKPLNETPLLVTGGSCRPNKDGKGSKLVFQAQGGEEAVMQLSDDTLHAFCHLLAQSARQGGWDLELTMGGGNVVMPEGGEASVH